VVGANNLELTTVFSHEFFFIQLNIFILGKESPTSENLDVYLQLLVDELQMLWTGIRAQDFSQPTGRRWFNMRGILLWTISDFPGYGLISGLCTHGYKACIACGPATDARIARNGNNVDAKQIAKGRKLVYGGARRWTRRHHPYRRDLSFNGREEHGSVPVRMSPNEVLRCATERQRYIKSGGRPNVKDDPVHKHRVKRRCILWSLPYWSVSIETWRVDYEWSVQLYVNVSASPARPGSKLMWF
jgi:hypothetical protein